MLTDQQIQRLFVFCEQHRVPYYEVQVELVEHLANAVEMVIAAEQEISFERALEKVHRNFGTRGFAPLVRQKRRLALVQSRRLFWRLFSTHFRWPKIIFFLMIVTLLYSVFSAHTGWIKWVFSLVMIGAISSILYVVILQQSLARTGRKFLIVRFSWVTALLYMPFNVINISRVFRDQSFINYTPARLLIPGMSLFIGLFVILIVAAWQTLSSIKASLHRDYPEVFGLP